MTDKDFKIPGLRGWWQPDTAMKWHAFKENDRSLCGQYFSVGVEQNQFEEIWAEACPTTEDDCRHCAERVEKIWFAATEEE